MPGLLSTNSSITAIGGTQYLSIRYTEHLAEAGIEPSVGSVVSSSSSSAPSHLDGNVTQKIPLNDVDQLSSR